jgi:hypothetical protein
MLQGEEGSPGARGGADFAVDLLDVIINRLFGNYAVPENCAYCLHSADLPLRSIADGNAGCRWYDGPQEQDAQAEREIP